MNRVVLDTNVLVSALLERKGKPYRTLSYASSKYVWLTSQFILDELADVLTRKHIQKKYSAQVSSTNRQKYFELIEATAEVVAVTTKIEKVSRDFADDPVLACVKDGRANYLVTGDPHLLDLKTYAAAQIVTPDKFLQFLSKK